MEPTEYRFGPFVLDRREYSLRRDDRLIDLPPKSLDLLLYLVERPGSLLTKDALFRAIWPDVAVTDNALTQVVSEIRRALGDDPSAPVYLQTVARRGYRFIGVVERVGAEPYATRRGRPASRAAAASTPIIAILDFENLASDTEMAWLSSGIPETVSADLRAVGARVVDRKRVSDSASRGRTWGETARDLGAQYLVSGSFQRAGDRLRITARLTDASTGDVETEAKADGSTSDVFQVQDAITRELAKTFKWLAPSDGNRKRQTSSLNAYRAAVEGRLMLESLDADAIPAAAASFARAIELDPEYAPAYVGLANARCCLFERMRYRPDPPSALLNESLSHARRGLELDGEYAEGYATLAFVLTSAGRRAEAREEALRAIGLEPDQWLHHFRLGNATWGGERVTALRRVLELYPEFPFAHFQLAMVDVARGALNEAARTLSEGLAIQRRHQQSPRRFPASGLYWLLGMIALARNDSLRALDAFGAEIASSGRYVYSREFQVAAHWGRGFAYLALARHEEAAREFQAVIAEDGSGRAALGLVLAERRDGDTGRVNEAVAIAAQLSSSLRRAGRDGPARMLDTGRTLVEGDANRALILVEQAIASDASGFPWWWLPIDPLFAPLHHLARFRSILEAVASGAR